MESPLDSWRLLFQLFPNHWQTYSMKLYYLGNFFLIGKMRGWPLYTKMGHATSLIIIDRFLCFRLYSKVFERIIYGQLYEYLTQNNILSRNQFGFRRMHSTVTALLNSTNTWLLNMDRGLFNIAIFLDLQKAFDTVNHEILLKKLELYGVTNNGLLKSYLSDRKQSCLINNTYSSEKLITCGVPQGSILGPLLFLVYRPLSRLWECS